MRGRPTDGRRPQRQGMRAARATRPDKTEQRRHERSEGGMSAGKRAKERGRPSCRRCKAPHGRREAPQGPTASPLEGHGRPRSGRPSPILLLK